MKKRWILAVLSLFVIVCSILAVGCVKKPDTSSESKPHSHSLQKVYASNPTCTEEGKSTHFYCAGCDTIFADSFARQTLPREEVYTAKLPHVASVTAAKDSTCDMVGNVEYWTCEDCHKYFIDEECTQEKTKAELIVSKKPHQLNHQAKIPVVGKNDGVAEHWHCSACLNYFLDENGENQVTADDVILYSLLNIPDFLIELEEDRDPVILQLTDTQIIDAGQAPNRQGIDHEFWATDKMDERCFNYLREIITAVNPDFIFITGDVIYGEFDVDGSVWLKFIEFMDSFKTPWSLVFGNHDNESEKGVDWQCEQLEQSEYCYFEQKTLTGNGNYSVGIAYRGELKRVFYMLDTNACGNASEATKQNSHTRHDFLGFGEDQIEWYTKQITRIKAISPDTKISFAYHIQQWVFGDAMKKYGYNYNEDIQDINLYTNVKTAEGDFGYIGTQMKGNWDTNKKIYKAMKELGVDSIFVGHEHSNSASIVYDGIRFQYGQKSSEYDRYNYVDANGQIHETEYSSHPAGTTPLIGGSVIVLSKEDGSIKDAYIYFCENAGGKIDWDDYK